MKRENRKKYQASFTIESVFLVTFFCMVVCYFIFCVFFQYDLVRLQANKIYMQYAQMSEEEMEEKAAAGCVFFRAGSCEQEDTPTKMNFEMAFYIHKGSFWENVQDTEVLMHGEWDKLSVMEEIRLASVCMELLH